MGKIPEPFSGKVENLMVLPNGNILFTYTLGEQRRVTVFGGAASIEQIEKAYAKADEKARKKFQEIYPETAEPYVPANVPMQAVPMQAARFPAAVASRPQGRSGKRTSPESAKTLTLISGINEISAGIYGGLVVDTATGEQFDFRIFLEDVGSKLEGFHNPMEGNGIPGFLNWRVGTPRTLLCKESMYQGKVQLKIAGIA